MTYIKEIPKKVGMFKRVLKNTAEMLLVGLAISLAFGIVATATAWAVALQ